MKFNLKKAKECWDTADEYHCLQKWFEGFEKELQKLINSFSDNQLYVGRLLKNHLRKEILGE